MSTCQNQSKHNAGTCSNSKKDVWWIVALKSIIIYLHLVDYSTMLGFSHIVIVSGLWTGNLTRKKFNE
jgi:hypothetical protein